MTKFLTELITDKTPILELQSNDNISREEKLKILDLNSSISKLYIMYMYYYNDFWYYFKKDDFNGGYPFYIIDEIMGSYLAKMRNLPTVSYSVAMVEDSYGIASINFKKDSFNYYTISQLIDGITVLNGLQNIDLLRSLTIDEENEKQFINHLFNLFALDIHMLQKDRGEVNLQFEVNKETGYFDVAPLYDYSNCSYKVGPDGINIMNKIIKLNDLSIRSLLRKYPEFKKSLEFSLEQSMKKIWEQICLDYHFNQDCSAYDRISDYYELKDKSQKQYIKQMITDAKR